MNRLILSFIAVAGIVLCLASCTDNDKTVAGKDNSRLLKKAPFAGITDSIEQSPEDPELYLRRATLLSRNNEHSLATADYKKAWEITGDESVALEYASNLLLSDQVPQALKILNEGSEKFPDNTEFNRRLAEINFQMGKFDDALQQYDIIISKDSSNFEAWFDKGSLQVKMKDTSGAIYSLENSFSLLPINYSGIALANLYASQKDPRALEVCNILLAKDSGAVQVEPIYMKGVYYAEVKEYDNAIRQFDECIKRDWKMTDAYIEKGIILFERNNYAEAIKVFNMAITVSNTDADAYYWLGRCYESTGDRQQALTNYERAYALDNSFIEAGIALKRLNG